MLRFSGYECASACPRERVSSVQFKTNLVSLISAWMYGRRATPWMWDLPSVTHFLFFFTFVMEYGSLCLWGKICKAKQISVTRHKSRREGSGFGLPEGIALLCGNKSCYWLDKPCMGLRRCGAKDFNCLQAGHCNWSEKFNLLYLSVNLPFSPRTHCLEPAATALNF